MFFIGGSYGLALEIAAVHSGMTDSQAIHWRRCFEALYTIDIIVNWFVTLMIIWKLWRVGHRAMAITDRGTNRYLSIILALIESGMLYSVVGGLYNILFFLQMVSRFVLSCHCYSLVLLIRAL